MRIDINNCSSPGASFTENTNRVLICTLQWIRENNYPVIEFKTLRTILEKKYGVNNNNARNIYPLLKNCGFINYSKGVIETEHFLAKLVWLMFWRWRQFHFLILMKMRKLLGRRK